MLVQNNLIKKCLILLLCLSAAACSSTPKEINKLQAIESSNAPSFSAIKIAKAQLGTKYRYGGNKPSQGFDCSGLIHYSFSRIGVTIPRSSTAQFAALKPSKQLQKGNLVYFGSKGRVNHAGIYLGDNKMLHSPSSGGRVEIVRINTPRWQKRYLGARSV